MRKVHVPKYGSLGYQTDEIWAFDIQIAQNPQYLMLVHFISNQSKIREFSMGLYGTLNSPVFTFSRASDLKFGTHSCSFCVHCMMWFF